VKMSIERVVESLNSKMKVAGSPILRIRKTICRWCLVKITEPLNPAHTVNQLVPPIVAFSLCGEVPSLCISLCMHRLKHKF
jgi:hypothetical protein